jgi:CubicO group peptidase (beta-lactamase class C family)
MITATMGRHGSGADSDAAVPWWSFTKTVLAAAALALVAQGRLRLDEPMTGKPFTLRQVLGHRAGLADYSALSDYHTAVAEGAAPWPAAELLRRVQADRLRFAPGAGWAYSNVGYLLVRRLVEQAAEAPMAAAIARLVTAPLGIAGVTLARVPEDLDATAWGNARRYHPGWVYHGLLIGPAASAAALLHRLLDGALLPPELLDAMRARHEVGGPVPGRPWQSGAYGLGLMIGLGESGVEFIGHTGGGPGSTAAVFRRVGGGITAAAFAPCDHPGLVEAQAMGLAAPASQ